MHKVSIIIPYYKKELFIKKTIRSVLNQTYTNFEIILLYDDTDKKDLDFIRKLKSLDKRIKLFINKKNLGAYSDAATNSMYASHVITGAGFGGIVCFNDKKKYDRAKLLRGWGRSSAIFNESEGLKHRFSEKVDGIPYDGKYIFSELGFNFLPSEISAAFALEQLKKLKKNISIREKNFKKIFNFFKKLSKFFDLPVQDPKVKTGWLAYPVIIKKNSKIKRRDMQIYLEKKGIQTRTIFTGNILRQPIMKNKKFKKVNQCSVNSDNIMKNGILIGCHQGLNDKEITYIFKSINNFLKKSKII